jgi:hypothetical protein
MVIRYKFIKKIEQLTSYDYFYNYTLNNILKKSSKGNLAFLIISKVKKKIIYIFRYFFWMFFNLIMQKNLIKFLNYYFYVLNYIYLLNYLKLNKAKYYLLYYVSSINFIKKNKKIQRKFINYITLKKKIDILFFFVDNSFKTDFFFNSLSKRKLNILTINLISSSNIYFFLYLNNLIG